ncbi:glycosyltransferase 8 domain-containing protein 2 isoform X2 [Pteropus alecto]|uniref:glycosyltransferase 8 domain-containing protein 2 isoform X2 n=1 Tax=Pteropus alecto TaxID=9402 RepID=UPI000D537D48|nr:glycosyltransferase 8 domain-containing protein 2 isoform X2 [Pteropus alecto]
MALLRKINQVLLFLLIVTLCGILYKKVHKGTVLKNEAEDDSEMPEELEGEIPVVICAAAGRMGAAMAAINSIYSNTDANILFYVVGLRNTLSRIRKWIEHSKLREINFKVVEFNPMVLKGKIRADSSRPELLQPLNFVRFYLPLLIHQHEKVIYLDDDVIVQGDIQELYDTTLALGHAAAFSDDCDLPSSLDTNRLVGLQVSPLFQIPTLTLPLSPSLLPQRKIQNTYMGYLDYRKKTIKDLGISPSTCSFNPGVIVANMTEWKHQRITKQLEKWMQKNVEENLYSSSLGGGVATSPMLIVFHGKYSTINPLWHIRHLERKFNTIQDILKKDLHSQDLNILLEEIFYKYSEQRQY